jgi:FKBP-type peptidyl-prolyl cis-trans isomerase
VSYIRQQKTNYLRMKNRNFIIALAAIVVLGVSACNGGAIGSKGVKVENQTDSVAFALGLSIGGNLKKQFPDVNPEVISQAMIEAFQGKESKMFPTSQDADTYIRSYMQVAAEKKSVENKTKGEAFLAENAKKPGVKVTASGLQYEVIKEAQGEKPTLESTVKVHYHGTTIDGEVFDSSVDKGEPVSFPLNGVIPGWTEGVQLMSVGSKYKFYIPSELAYGPRQASAKIGPNSTLVFEVELLEIVKEPKQ